MLVERIQNYDFSVLLLTLNTPFLIIKSTLQFKDNFVILLILMINMTNHYNFRA